MPQSGKAYSSGPFSSQFQDRKSNDLIPNKEEYKLEDKYPTGGYHPR